MSLCISILSTIRGHYYASFKNSSMEGIGLDLMISKHHPPGTNQECAIFSSLWKLALFASMDSCITGESEYWMLLLIKTQSVYNTTENCISTVWIIIILTNFTIFLAQMSWKNNNDVDFAHFHDVNMFLILAKIRYFEIPYRNTLEGIIHLWKKWPKFVLFT